MKQIIQNLGNGKTSIQDGPVPSNKPGHLLIASRYSVISTGTERMLKSFGEANLLNKAKQQPDKVKQTLQKLRTDGFLSTLGAVKSKLDQPILLGYSNVGIVLESDVSGFKKGDKVVSNGNHAEIVCVPGNLCSKLPKSVDTILTGESGKLDSLGLVTFIVAVEERIQNDLGITISLADEIGKVDGALRTAETLADYIANELQS